MGRTTGGGKTGCSHWNGEGSLDGENDGDRPLTSLEGIKCINLGDTAD